MLDKSLANGPNVTDRSAAGFRFLVDTSDRALRTGLKR
jgi:hypothetical protein